MRGRKEYVDLARERRGGRSCLRLFGGGLRREVSAEAAAALEGGPRLVQGGVGMGGVGGREWGGRWVVGVVGDGGWGVGGDLVQLIPIAKWQTILP